MSEPVPERPTPPDDTEGLREQIEAAAVQWVVSCPFPLLEISGGTPSQALTEASQALAEAWGRQIADAVLAVLVEPPGDLREQMAEVLNATLVMPDGGIEKATEKWDRHDKHNFLYNCALCQGNVPALVAALAEVCGEDAARRIAAAEARAEHAEGQVSALRDHETRWETEKARADKAEAELEQYRARLAARITDEVGLSWQDLLDRAERLAEPHPTFDAFRLVDGQRLPAGQRAEAAEAQVAELQNERDLLREALGESDLGAQVRAQWEAIAAADADRDRLEAQVAALQRELAEAKTHWQYTDPSERARCVMCGDDHLARLFDAVVDARPDDPEEIRRLAQATTEETNDEH